MPDQNITVLPIYLIEPDRDQPRKNFKEESLSELAESIRRHGVLQPVLVRERDGYYQLIAGERRWRAARIAGLKKIPAIIREFSAQEAAEVALIENLQREDLNAVETARAYQRLIQDYGYSQTDVASKLSKSRSTVNNTLRLLELDDGILAYLTDGRLSEGHARALLTIRESSARNAVADYAVDHHLSVRELERYARSIAQKKEKRGIPTDVQREAALSSIQNDMESSLGIRVEIKDRKKGGEVVLKYATDDDLERIYELLRRN